MVQENVKGHRKAIWIADMPMLASAHFHKQVGNEIFCQIPVKDLLTGWGAILSGQFDPTKPETLVVQRDALYQVRTGKILNESQTLEQQGVSDGDVLVLIFGEIEAWSDVIRQTQEFPTQISSSFPAPAPLSYLEALKAQDVTIAETALRRPERVLILNMVLVVVLLLLGAAVLNVIQPFMFPILTAFVLTVTVVVNAFYLRSLGQISEKNFLRLMELALLKFFAPFAQKRETGA